MDLSRETLDDVLLALYPCLLEPGPIIEGNRDPFREKLGVLFEITKPRARLSRTETRGRAFSALGELLWYLTRDNQLSFVERYIPHYSKESEDKLTVRGGYGPRLFNQRGHDQVANVVRLLRERPFTKRAVVQIFDAEDTADNHLEVPCTTTFQFVIRDELLHMIVTMRSNDAFKGLPHDVFCFTMLQEIVARSLCRDVGTYRQFTGSMHLYERDRAKAEVYIMEGTQARREMPPMPVGDPWLSLATLLAAEARISSGEVIDAQEVTTDPYWADLVRLLQIFHAGDDVARVTDLRATINRRYHPYIDDRWTRKAGRSRADILTPSIPAGEGK